MNRESSGVCAVRTIRRQLVAVLVLLAASASPVAQPLVAPNVVVISDRLVTSGQPPAAALAQLGEAGFQAVVYLAPSDVHGAVRAEPDILARQGIEFVHIPIPFGSPDAGHVAALSQALKPLKDKKVLVHCEVNMRASSLVFLYRVITLREDPAQAYAAVTAVWSPRGPWRRLIEQQLRQAGVKFDLL
jgi:protein tyrosine phosphatase (PTP) superfamily phosphohydrolase (DUF442 family)